MDKRFEAVRASVVLLISTMNIFLVLANPLQCRVDLVALIAIESSTILLQMLFCMSPLETLGHRFLAFWTCVLLGGIFLVVILC